MLSMRSWARRRLIAIDGRKGGGRAGRMGVVTDLSRATMRHLVHSDGVLGYRFYSQRWLCGCAGGGTSLTIYDVNKPRMWAPCDICYIYDAQWSVSIRRSGAD